MKEALQSRVRAFLAAPLPQGMIPLPDSFAEHCLSEFAEHGEIARTADNELLLRATIQSYRTDADESDTEVKRRLLESANLLEEVWKQECERT